MNKFEDYIQNENFQTDKNYGKIIDFKSAAKAGEMAIPVVCNGRDFGLRNRLGFSAVCLNRMGLNAERLDFWRFS